MSDLMTTAMETRAAVSAASRESCSDVLAIS